MPTGVKATVVVPGFTGLTPFETGVLSLGASIVVFFEAFKAAGLLLYVIAALAIRFFETALVALADAGTADPRTVASRTFRNTGSEFTTIPRAFALFDRFCGERNESTCCPMIWDWVARAAVSNFNSEILYTAPSQSELTKRLRSATPVRPLSNLRTMVFESRSLIELTFVLVLTAVLLTG
jgi:hypothetical protein